MMERIAEASPRFKARMAGVFEMLEGLTSAFGQVVVLGATGKNFAAGMSGGIAYVLDQEGSFEKRCNTTMVTLHRLSTPEEITAVKGLIFKHLELTESNRAKEILGEWSSFEPLFWKVMPLPPANLAPPAAPAATTAPAPAKA